MKRLAAAAGLDVRLQARSRLYSIGVVVALVFGIGARVYLPAELVGRALPAFYLLALGGTTYMFGASLLLMERSEGTLQALRVSPLRTREYLAAKLLTLTGFAAVEAAIVFAVAARGAAVAPLPLVAGVLALGAGYTLLGLGQVASHDSVTAFLFPGALVVAGALQLPFLFVLGVGPDPLWYAIPSQGPLLLMLGAFEPLEPWQWVYAVTVSAGGVAAAWAFARARFRTHVGLAEG